MSRGSNGKEKGEELKKKRWEREYVAGRMTEGQEGQEDMGDMNTKETVKKSWKKFSMRRMMSGCCRRRESLTEALIVFDRRRRGEKGILK